MTTEEVIWMPMVYVVKDKVWGRGPSTPIDPPASEKRKKKVWGIAFYNAKLQKRTKKYKSRRRNGRLLAK